MIHQSNSLSDLLVQRASSLFRLAAILSRTTGIKAWFIIVFSALLALPGHGQYVVMGDVNQGDTIIKVNVREVIIFPKKFGSAREVADYQKLVRNVKKVYPYAKLASVTLKQMNDTLMSLKTDRQRKKFISQVDDRLQDKFGPELKKLSTTQGRILLKLIDRETGNTSYSLVKELKGSFSAFFWQGLARLFGHNLKARYDPKGEDKLIEQILVQIENGQL